MRSRLLKLVLLGIVAAAVMTPAAFSVTPGATLDQSQDVTEGCATFTPGTRIGQVFTAGVSGRLSDFLLTLGNASGAVGFVHVVLTGVDGSGLPDLSAEIASVDLPSSSIPVPDPALVDLQFGNPSLAVGNQYAVLVSTSDTTGYEICGGGSIDYYTGGQAWGTTDGGASWSDVGGDSHFSTYMLPPSNTREGYCLNGRFLNLAVGQPNLDPTYSGAVPSIFVRGLGISCDPPPPGYTQQGRTTDNDNVGAGTYALWAPAT